MKKVLLLTLTKFSVAVHIAPGKQVKDFIRSFGKYAKTDKIDAIAIANYGYERQATLRLYSTKDETSLRLRSLIFRRLDLVQILVQEKNRYKAPNNNIIKDSIKRSIEFIDGELEGINNQIKELISEAKDYAKKSEVLQTIPGIGKISSPTLLALLPELGTLSRREIASLCGVAPHPKQSGKSSRYASTIGGRRMIRPILYLCAMAASRGKTRLGDWYRSLISKGKKPLVALVALMRKIIVIANAKLKDFEKGILVNSESRN